MYLTLISLAILQVRGGGGFNPPPGGGGAAGAGIGIMNVIIWIFELALIVLTIAGMWKTFEKAGQPGWAAIIPIYNLMVLAEIGGKPSWWGIVAACVPCVGIIFVLLIDIGVAERFGQGAGFGIGLWLLGFVFFPILGFGSSEFEGGKRRRRSRDDDDDDDDRPRRRSRDDDDEEEEDDRPRRRKASAEDEDDDEDDPRIKRRRRDDDD